MQYCFVTKRDACGSEPDGPGQIGWRLLADLPDVDWALYESAAVDGAEPGAAEPVAPALARLIESGKRYPPALALAREEVVEVLAGERPDRFDFTTALSAALRAYLERQHEAPFLMVPALADGVDGLRRGEWYWVLQITGTPAVASWVSDELVICENPAADFDLTGLQLRRLTAG